MIAATMIDAKLYIIPLSIVWIATAVALVVLPGSVLLGWVPADLLSLAEARATWQQLIPYASHTASWVAVGSTVGLIGAIVLLRMKVLPLSFAEEIELPEGADPDDPDLMVAHPHPRREVGKEVLFLMLPMLGAALGYGASVLVDASGQGHPVWHVIGGVLLGYLVGGGVVWVTRILGTLAFGKEAMGLGDVHLMAAVGAVIGWRDTTLAFFIAPFFGIAAVVIQMGVTALIKKRHSPIPYGPYLCGAAVVVMVWRQPIFDTIFP
ncbi:MAG: A24 family peptidase [Planctomycetota bacterium]